MMMIIIIISSSSSIIVYSKLIILFIYLFIYLFNQAGSLKSKKHKVFFEDPKTESGKTFKFDGCPYVILGRKVYHCQHRLDRHAKEKNTKQKNSQVRKEKAEEVSILQCVSQYF